MSVSMSLALVFCLGAVLTDLRAGKVENGWVLAGYLSGLLCRLCADGPRGLLLFLAGAGMPIALLFILFLFRMIGAGDIKILSVAGGLLGAGTALDLILWSFVFAAVLSLAILRMEGSLLRRLRRLGTYIRYSLAAGRRVPYRASSGPETELHFTVPVFMSVMLAAGGGFL